MSSRNSTTSFHRKADLQEVKAANISTMRNFSPLFGLASSWTSSYSHFLLITLLADQQNPASTGVYRTCTIKQLNHAGQLTPALERETAQRIERAERIKAPIKFEPPVRWQLGDAREQRVLRQRSNDRTRRIDKGLPMRFYPFTPRHGSGKMPTFCVPG